MKNKERANHGGKDNQDRRIEHQTRQVVRRKIQRGTPMMPYTNAKTPLRDVLYTFSMTKPIPDAELLDQFIRRYPEYRAALIEFATAVAIANIPGEDDALPGAAA